MEMYREFRLNSSVRNRLLRSCSTPKQHNNFSQCTTSLATFLFSDQFELIYQKCVNRFDIYPDKERVVNISQWLDPKLETQRQHRRWAKHMKNRKIKKKERFTFDGVAEGVDAESDGDKKGKNLLGGSS